MEPPASVMLLLASVELALLVISVALLVLSRREHSGREALLEAILRATRELTRYEYFSSVIDGILSSRRSISGIVTGRRPVTTVGREAVARIVEALRKASSRGVSIRYIVYPSPDRLTVAYAYKRAGALIRFHPYAGLADSRYTIIDGESVIIGIAGKEKEHPTRMGYVIRSRSLAQILERHFEDLWSEAEDFDSYLARLVREYSRGGAGPAEIARHLEVPVEEVEKHIGEEARH